MNWIDSYYEALEFFYFEPQHLRRKRQVNPELQQAIELAKRSSNFETVKKHLREMEVTLNHNITQFFYLAPDDLRNQLFERVFEEPIKGMFKLHGREVESYFGPENVMQPDFLFVSESSTVSIEMKVNSQSNIDQVMKYALLALVLEKREQRQKLHYLVLLGRGTLAHQFKEHFKTPEDLKRALAEDVRTEFLCRKKKWQGDKKRFFQIVESMRIAFWNYERFSNFLQDARPSELDKSLGAEVCRKLVDGLRDEFSLRKLL